MFSLCGTEQFPSLCSSHLHIPKKIVSSIQSKKRDWRERMFQALNLFAPLYVHTRVDQHGHCAPICILSLWKAFARWLQLVYACAAWRSSHAGLPTSSVVLYSWLWRPLLCSLPEKLSPSFCCLAHPGKALVEGKDHRQTLPPPLLCCLLLCITVPERPVDQWAPACSTRSSQALTRERAFCFTYSSRIWVPCSNKCAVREVVGTCCLMGNSSEFDFSFQFTY